MEDTYRSQFRLPQSLYEKLRVATQKSGRSLNSEIVTRLEASFAAQETVEERDARRAELRILAQEEIRLMMEQGLIPTTTSKKK